MSRPSCRSADLLNDIAVIDDAKNGCIIRKLDIEVGTVHCRTVMWEQEEQERAEHSDLGDAYVGDYS